MKEYLILDVSAVHAVLETYKSSLKQWVEKTGHPLWPFLQCFTSQTFGGECEPSEYGTESQHLTLAPWKNFK